MPTFTMEMPPELSGSYKDLQKLRQYLMRLCDALAYTLNNLDVQNVRAGGLTAACFSNLTAETLKAVKTEIGRARIGAAQIQQLEATVAQICTATIETADIDWAHVTGLVAALAEMIKVDIQEAEIDFAKIRDLIADKSIFAQGEAGELYIADLAVTEGNMVRLSLGQLLLKGADGGYFEVVVGDDGEVTARKSDVTEAIDEGQLSGGKLIDGSITASKLNAQDIFADNAIIRQLMAANIDVDTLFAREATINAINAMDILANEQLRVFVDGQNALNEKLKAWFNFSQEGVLGIGRSDTAFSTTISFEELAFWYYTTKAAYMRGDKLHVPNAVVEESIKIGDLTAEVDGDYIVWS